MKTHIGYNVYNLDETIKFYQEIFGAHLEFRSKKRNSASLNLGGCEVNLFETKDFGGYHSSLTKALHIGFQVPTKEQVDKIYERAQQKTKTIFNTPYERFDGDYTFFIQDPDGMQLEVYFGNHNLERAHL